MSKRSLIIITAAVASLCLVQAAAAQGQSLFASRGDHDGTPRLERLTGLLDLSEEQEEAIEAIQEQARAEGVELKKQQARLRNEIEGELLADQPSESKLVRLTEELGALRTQLQVIRLKARLAVRAELTDEQRDQLVLMGGRGGRGGQGLHRRHFAPRALEDELRRHRHRLHRFHQEHDEDEI